MDDLVQWLRAQLDEDERVATRAAEVHPAPWRLDDETVVDANGDNLGLGYDGMWEEVCGDHAQHIARHDPARVLREVEAKRRILAEHRPDYSGNHCELCVDFHASWGPEMQALPCSTLRLLALPYSDRPGYRKEEWRP